MMIIVRRLFYSDFTFVRLENYGCYLGFSVVFFSIRFNIESVSVCVCVCVVVGGIVQRGVFGVYEFGNILVQSFLIEDFLVFVLFFSVDFSWVVWRRGYVFFSFVEVLYSLQMIFFYVFFYRFVVVGGCSRSYFGSLVRGWLRVVCSFIFFKCKVRICRTRIVV